MLDDLTEGEPVLIVDCWGGSEPIPAMVSAISKLYVSVEFTTGKRTNFYRESGWRAWDGEMRWRLTRPRNEVVK